MAASRLYTLERPDLSIYQLPLAFSQRLKANGLKYKVLSGGKKIGQYWEAIFVQVPSIIFGMPLQYLHNNRIGLSLRKFQGGLAFGVPHLQNVQSTG